MNFIINKALGTVKIGRQTFHGRTAEPCTDDAETVARSAADTDDADPQESDRSGPFYFPTPGEYTVNTPTVFNTAELDVGGATPTMSFAQFHHESKSKLKGEPNVLHVDVCDRSKFYAAGTSKVYRLMTHNDSVVEVKGSAVLTAPESWENDGNSSYDKSIIKLEGDNTFGSLLQVRGGSKIMLPSNTETDNLKARDGTSFFPMQGAKSSRINVIGGGVVITTDKSDIRESTIKVPKGQVVIVDTDIRNKYLQPTSSTLYSEDGGSEEEERQALWNRAQELKLQLDMFHTDARDEVKKALDSVTASSQQDGQSRTEVIDHGDLRTVQVWAPGGRRGDDLYLKSQHNSF